MDNNGSQQQWQEKRAREASARLQARRGQVKLLGRKEFNTASRQRLLVMATAVLLAAGSLLYVSQSRAAGAGVHLEAPRIDQGNDKSLQRGAKAFINYCMGCHSAGYQRYSRMAQDLGLSEAEVEQNMIFTTDDAGEPTKVGSLMTNAMTTDYAKQVFGVAPPNLALTARSRGTDWVYTYLKSYYLDPEKTTTGVNNLVFPGTAMPHVLWNLQGWQTLEHESSGEGEHGAAAGPVLKLEEQGAMSPEEYDSLVADITNFMAYMSDPIKETRHKVGIFVLLFLFLLLVVAYMLKKEYWKDVV